MATYTPNIGLHQWVPEDDFLRTDFNEDFQKIDTAVGNKADTSSVNSSLSSLQSQLNNKASTSSITSLQNQINSISTTVGGKTRVVAGTYVGTDAVQTINLGAQPWAVLVGRYFYTVCAVRGGGTNNQLTITSNGFSVSRSTSAIDINELSMAFPYVALL